MHKETVVDQIEVRRNGDVQVRFGKLIVNDDGTLAAEPQWHRTVFHPDTDVDAQMAAVNAHLKSMGEAEVDAAEVKRVRDHAKTARTPEVLKAHAERIEQQKAKELAK